MKRKLIATMLPVLMLGAFSSTVFAEGEGGEPSAPTAKITVDGGKVNFTGSVVAAPCAVENASESQVVRLGMVPTNELTSKGDSSGSVPFSIKLTGCDLSSDLSDPTKAANYTKASITFAGSTAGDDSTLAVSSSGAGSSTAQNVGVQVFRNNEVVKVDGSSASAATNLIPGTNEIPFSAAYVATADNVTAGMANASVNFSVTYE